MLFRSGRRAPPPQIGRSRNNAEDMRLSAKPFTRGHLHADRLQISLVSTLCDAACRRPSRWERKVRISYPRRVITTSSRCHLSTNWGPRRFESGGELWPKPLGPAPNALVADDDATSCNRGVADRSPLRAGLRVRRGDVRQHPCCLFGISDTTSSNCLNRGGVMRAWPVAPIMLSQFRRVGPYGDNIS